MAAKGTSPSVSYAAFVSYAKADGKRAQEVADCLEERGFKCWIAPRNVRPGRAYGDEIIRGIESSRCLILVLSSASNQSAFVAREIERAVSKRKPVFPIRIEDVEPSASLELFISSTQWIDAFSGKLGSRIDQLASLLAEEEGVEPPVASAAAERSVSSKRFIWLGIAAALVVVALAAVLLLRPADDPRFDYQACLNLSGDGALTACEQAIASGAFSGQEAAALYATRGYQRQVKSDLKGALSDYGEAIERDPALVVAFNNRGNIYRDIGEYDQAIADYDRALELDPNSADPLASRGWIYHQRGEIDRAREDFARALTLKPDPSLKVKLEDALAATEPKKDPEVISDPSVFLGPRDSGFAASMPASPEISADTAPAVPPPGFETGPAGGPP